MTARVGHTEHLAAPVGRYLVALVLRSAAATELPLSVYCHRVESGWDGSLADLKAFRALAIEAAATELGELERAA